MKPETSPEMRAFIRKMQRKYGPPTESIEELQRMMDRALGYRSLTEELEKMRNGE
ncbi:MAG: hypothetical protein HY261_08010 [Chloroflexi bacterium]|nr:hypothetical protein [Chloroflexota bacterium]